MNSFFQIFPIQLFALGLVALSIGCSEDGNSGAMKEVLLQTEVELLSERLASLDREMEFHTEQAEKNQRTLIKESSVIFRDLSETNLTATIERYLVPPGDFSKLLESNEPSEIHGEVRRLTSEKKATAKPILIGTLSTVSEEGIQPALTISDQSDLNVPIDFEPVSGNEDTNPNPKLAPKEWIKEDLGTSFTATLLAREGDRFLLGIEFKDIIRLKNEPYPFPKIFADKDPGHLEMPVFHEGEINTNITATIGVPEFIGTTVVPDFDNKNTDQFQAVFVTILSSTK